MTAPKKKRSSQSDMDATVARLVDRFIADVSAGRYTVGTFIPSPRESARIYNVSLSTARKLFEKLKEAGQIRTIPRKGTILTGTVTRASASRTEIFKTGIIVVGVLEYINPTAVHNLTSRALGTIENACRQNGIQIQFYNLHRDMTKTLSPDAKIEITDEDIRQINHSGASGCIVINVSQLDSRKNFPMWKKLKMPAVFLEGNIPNTRRIQRDEKSSGCLAAEHLLKLKHEKIAFLGYDTDLLWQKQRLEGIRETLEEQNLTLIEDWKEKFPYRDPHTLENDVRLPLLQEIKHILNACTAVICSTDVLGMLILQYARTRQIPPPSIVTFDDAQQYRPWDMTSVRDPIEDMGLSAFQLLLATLRDGSGSKGKTVLVPGCLFKRSSSQKLVCRQSQSA